VTRFALATSRKRRLGLTAVASVAMSMALIASPAFAGVGGSASGTGEETAFTPGSDFGTGSHPHCLEVTGSSYSVDLDSGGTYDANTGNGAAYTGTATLTWSTSGTYFIDEDGTYQTANHVTGCVLTGRGYAVPAVVNLIGGNTTAGIDCADDMTGTYSRTFNGAITVSFTGACTVYATTGSGVNTTPTNTQYTFTGTLNPCFDTDPCTASTIDPGSLSF
jgi:hypothetical protein